MAKKVTPPRESRKRGPDGMTPMMRRFAQEYVVDLNATQAAKRAGAQGKEKNFRVLGSRWLRDPYVAYAIEAAIAERAERTKVGADMIVDNLRTIAMDNKTSNRDKIAALHLLGKHIGMFVNRQKVEHSGTVEIENAARSFESRIMDVIARHHPGVDSGRLN